MWQTWRTHWLVETGFTFSFDDYKCYVHRGNRRVEIFRTTVVEVHMLWSMRDGFIYRRPEVQRSELPVVDETTFSNSMQFVDVMRQTRTSIDNASECALDDCWNDESEVLLSGVRLGTTRFRISRIKLPERIHLGERSIYKQSTIWPEEWPRLSKKQKARGECQLRRKREQDCKKLDEKEESSTSRPKTQNTSR